MKEESEEISTTTQNTLKYHRRCHFQRCFLIQGGVTLGAKPADLYVHIYILGFASLNIWHGAPQCTQCTFPGTTCLELGETFIS